MPSRGYYSGFGGSFIPEILVATFEELNDHFDRIRDDPVFWREYAQLMSSYSCRPTPVTFAENLTRHFGGARIYIKREDFNHTGAHKANNVMGQGLLTRRMGKRRVIAETGAGQHGVATATMAAKFGFECTIYMVRVSYEQKPYRKMLMHAWGADCYPSPTDRTNSGRAILAKDPDTLGSLGIAISEAVEDAATHDDTKY